MESYFVTSTCVCLWKTFWLLALTCSSDSVKPCGWNGSMLHSSLWKPVSSSSCSHGTSSVTLSDCDCATNCGLEAAFTMVQRTDDIANFTSVACFLKLLRRWLNILPWEFKRKKKKQEPTVKMKIWFLKQQLIMSISGSRSLSANWIVVQISKVYIKWSPSFRWLLKLLLLY